MQLLRSKPHKCEKTHNRVISDLLNVDCLRTIHSLPAEKNGFSPDEIARLNAGVIFDAQYLKFLSDIALGRIHVKAGSDSSLLFLCTWKIRSNFFTKFNLLF